MAGPWGAGSTSAVRVVCGLERMNFACRGPIRPPPMIAILSGVVIGGSDPLWW